MVISSEQFTVVVDQCRLVVTVVMELLQKKRLVISEHIVMTGVHMLPTEMVVNEMVQNVLETLQSVILLQMVENVDHVGLLLVAIHVKHQAVVMGSSICDQMELLIVEIVEKKHVMIETEFHEIDAQRVVKLKNVEILY
jgi:hypothetical protein